jgi:hypothetical protein
MATKKGRGGGASGRTILVVEAGEGSAETLLAELASRGYPASVLRGERAEKAAGLASDSDGDAGSSFSEEQIRLLLGGLTASEIKLLWILLRNVGNPVSDGDIYRELYGGKGAVDSRASEQAVRRLRRKLGPLGASIERQRGVGIRWNPDPGKRAGIAFDRIFRLFSHYRAAVLSFFLVLGFAAGWLLRAGAGGPGRTEPAEYPSAEAEQRFPPPPPPVEAFMSMDWTGIAPGHGPECAIDGNTNTWFQTAGPARKRDLVQILYRPNVRGRLDVRCGVPGSTNALPSIRVAVQYSDDEQRRLGFVDPETGAFSCDLREKPVYKVFVVVAADSDEPLAVRSVTIDP